MASEFIPRPSDEQVTLLTEYLSDAPARRDSESDTAYINRIIVGLSETQADELITNLIIIRQANTLARHQSQPAATIIDDTATVLFGKSFAECDHTLRTGIRTALQRKLIQQKSLPIAAGTD